MTSAPPAAPPSAARSIRSRRSSFVDSEATEDGDVDADAPETATDTTTNEDGEAQLLARGDGELSQTLACGEGCRSGRKLGHLRVPRRVDFEKRFSEENSHQGEITTLMIRNIPNTYTRALLMEELDSLGFQGKYDFIYLPIDKSTQWNVGYAFVNFKDPVGAEACVKAMTSHVFQRLEHSSGKVAQISVAHIQGLERNMEYYSRTAVQCARIQSHRPLVLAERPKDASSRRSRRRRRHGRGRQREGQDGQDGQQAETSTQTPSSCGDSTACWSSTFR